MNGATDGIDARHAACLSRRDFLTKSAVGACGAAAAVVAPSPVISFAGAVSGGDRPDDVDASVATGWFDLAGTLVRTTPGFTPPVAARVFGYAGVVLYEVVAPGSRHRRSLAGALPELPRLPSGRRGLHWPAAANAALARLLGLLFGSTGDANRASIDALEASFATEYRRETSRAGFRNSVARGRDVARTVFEWSRDDGGHESHLRNFPPDYVPPVGPGMWEPTPPAFQTALQPFWGRNRCLAVSAPDVCPPGDHPRFSEHPGSSFYGEALEVFEAVNNRTTEQEAIARFWSDDPGATATPPGHSISIASQVLRGEEASLMRAAETYAKVGIAVNDAFICCWHTKYRYNLIRPVTYLRRLVDPEWLPLLTTPPFPEYTSGHSVQSGAAFRVLAELFGPGHPFTDHTHDDRGLPARRFDSFDQAAEQAALSRLYGGIHFRAAIERGLAQGRCIGDAVARLPIHR